MVQDNLDDESILVLYRITNVERGLPSSCGRHIQENAASASYNAFRLPVAKVTDTINLATVKR